MKKGGKKNSKAYIIGSGIAGLATAVFLIKDGGLNPHDIYIIDQSQQSGGSFDGNGAAKAGYVSRGFRMFEKYVYSCTYDLLSRVPSPDIYGNTLKDDMLEFNRRVKIHSKARLISGGKIIDAHHLGLNWHDRLNLFKLLLLPESIIGTHKISDYFTSEFFRTNFWLEWATTFSFEPRHSAVEMKRYLARFLQDASQLDTMTCVLSSPNCEYDFFVLPIIAWLKKSGVNFWQDCLITDMEFDAGGENKFVKALLSKNGIIKIDTSDLVFVTNGSITADSSIGAMDKAPKPVKAESSSLKLWQNLAQRNSGFGKPEVFCSHINKSEWISFTITCSNSQFIKLIEKLTGNSAGTGGLITFKDSPWLISISIPHQPYFKKQSKNTYVCWGYGLSSNSKGSRIRKKMVDCSGREIMEELLYHLNMIEKKSELLDKIICLPVLMPYITSQFLPHKKSDRPTVVINGISNLACIGQYVEIPKEIVFTVEASVRSAKIAVNKLLNLSNSIPTLHQKQHSPIHIVKAIFTSLR